MVCALYLLAKDDEMYLLCVILFSLCMNMSFICASDAGIDALDSLMRGHKRHSSPPVLGKPCIAIPGAEGGSISDDNSCVRAKKHDSKHVDGCAAMRARRKDAIACGQLPVVKSPDETHVMQVLTGTCPKGSAFSAHLERLRERQRRILAKEESDEEPEKKTDDALDKLLKR